MSCRFFFLFLQALFVQHKGTNTRKCIVSWFRFSGPFHLAVTVNFCCLFFLFSLFIYLFIFFFILFVEFILAFSWTLYIDCSSSRLTEEQQLVEIPNVEFLCFINVCACVQKEYNNVGLPYNSFFLRVYLRICNFKKMNEWRVGICFYH